MLACVLHGPVNKKVHYEGVIMFLDMIIYKLCIGTRTHPRMRSIRMRTITSKCNLNALTPPSSMVRVVFSPDAVAPKSLNMATSSVQQLEELQARLEKSLSELGYSGKFGKLPAAVARNEKVMQFLSWMIDNLSPDNHLTSAELEK